MNNNNNKNSNEINEKKNSFLDIIKYSIDEI